MQLLARYCQSAISSPECRNASNQLNARDTPQYLFYQRIDVLKDGAPSNGGISSLDTFMDGGALVTLRGKLRRPDWAPRF